MASSVIGHSVLFPSGLQQEELLGDEAAIRQLLSEEEGANPCGEFRDITRLVPLWIAAHVMAQLPPRRLPPGFLAGFCSTDAGIRWMKFTARG